MLKVSGSGIVPIMRTTSTPGTTTTTSNIYGNDVILNAFGVNNVTYYMVQIFTVSGGFVSSTPALQNFYAFTGSGTVDLATATPLVPNFMNSSAGVSIPGTFSVTGLGTFNSGITGTGTIGALGLGSTAVGANNAFTGNNTHSGTEAFTGAVFTKLFNNVYYANAFATGGTGLAGNAWTSPSGTGGIQEAINAAPAGSTIYLSSGFYQVTSTINITKIINLQGSGWQSEIVIPASVGATTDIFHIAPSSAVLSDFRASNFAVIPQGGGSPGRHVFNFDGTNGEIAYTIIDHILVQPALGGNFLFASGSGGGQGTPFFGKIFNCVAYGGIVGTNIGDTFMVQNNFISGPRAVDVSFNIGASMFLLTENGIVSDGGIHIGTGSYTTRITNNEIETASTFTGSNGAVIDLDGTVGSPITAATIENNSFQVVNGITANGIRVNYANLTNIKGNAFERGATTSKDITVTANATNTFVGTNMWNSGGPFSSILSDSGTATALATQYPTGGVASWLLNNNRGFGSLDEAGNNQLLLYTDNGGNTTYYGYHSSPLIKGLNGLSILWDGAGNIAEAISNAPSALPIATAVITTPVHANKEIAAPLAAAGYDICYGDSSAHALECSYNNGAFGLVPLTNAINSFSGNTVALTADWTCGAGGTVSTCVAATIIGSDGGVPLTFTLPLFARSYTLECDGVVGQATAPTGNNWNLLTAMNGATNVTSSYSMNTAAAAMTGGATTDTAFTTTTFNIGPTWTLGAVGTKMPFHILARIEGASVSGTVVSLQLVAPTVGDLVTIYRGAACRIF
jgi:hypothetical protein